jgi:cell division septation protein DedD
MVSKKILQVLSLAAVLGMAGCSRQQSDWQKTRETNTSEAYEQYLKKYPSGEFSAQAQARVKELYEERDWQKARDADTLDAYQTFLKQYPEGKWTEEARIRVENFTLASAPPNNSAPSAAAASPGGEPPPSATPGPSAAKPIAPAVPRQGPSATASSGAYGVQLGAFKSGADAANKHWAKLEKAYPKLLAGLTPKVVPKKDGTGTVYRLQVVDLSEKRASGICRDLKGHAQACLIIHP